MLRVIVDFDFHLFVSVLISVSVLTVFVEHMPLFIFHAHFDFLAPVIGAVICLIVLCQPTMRTALTKKIRMTAARLFRLGTSQSDECVRQLDLHRTPPQRVYRPLAFWYRRTRGCRVSLAVS